MTMNQINTMSQQVLSNYDTYFSSAIVVSDNVQVYVDNLDFKDKNNQTSTRNYFGNCSVYCCMCAFLSHCRIFLGEV